jgi:iron(III) transport system permease protein
MNVQAAARLRRLLLWLPFLLVTCGPVVYLIGRSFFPHGGPFSLEPYAKIFGSTEAAGARRETLWNSLELGLIVVAVTLLAGVPFGFLVARTDLKLRRVYEALVVVPLLLPPYLAGIAWIQIQPMHGLRAIVFILGSALFPVVALLSARAFRDIDADVEDAARLVGERRALFKVTLPLARGEIVAAALLVFVFAISDFVVPDFFSFAVGGESIFQVFATEVYGAFARQSDPITATATAVPLVILSALALLLLARAWRKRSVASFGGAHAEPRPFRMGRLAVIGHLFLIVVLGATAVVPVASLVRMATRQPGPMPTVPAAGTGTSSQAGAAAAGTSQQPAAGSAGTSATPPPPPTVDLTIYRQRSPVATALKRYVPDVLHSLRNAAGAVVLLILAAFGPARALVNARRGRYAQRVLVLLPLAFPSLLIGMAFEQLFLADAGVLDRVYRGWGLVSLTLASRFLPVAVLGLAAAWSRLAPEIEESAQLAPVAPAKRFLRISLPLLVPGIAAVAVLTLGLSLREFDAIVLLPGAQEMLTNRIYSLVHWAQDAVVGALALLQVGSVLVPWLALRLLFAGRRS